MKKLITLIAMLTAVASAKAQTNATQAIVAPDLTLTNAPADTNKNYGKYDFTLGGDGFVNPHSGQSGFQFDIGLSTDPFKKIPALWVGIDQGIAWEPSFSGSTDVSIYYSFDIYKGKVYCNPGWSAGAVYGGDPTQYRSGPLLEFQYYITDSVFIYNDINYDAILSHGQGGLRDSFGLGFEF